MPLTVITVHGRRCVTLHGLAELYEVEFDFVVEAYELGLLGAGFAVPSAPDPAVPDPAVPDPADPDPAVAVAIERLDRMATLCRWHRLADPDPAGIAPLLDLLPDLEPDDPEDEIA